MGSVNSYYPINNSVSVFTPLADALLFFGGVVLLEVIFMSNPKAELIEFIAGFTHDPLGFVVSCFPWGQGELTNYTGPDEWQKNVLKHIGEELRNGVKSEQEVIREAVASGNGVGKSAMVSWIILWAISTHEDTRGVVTANTETQLRSKTWPEVTKWHRLFLGKDLFEVTATSIFSSQKDHEKTWRIDAIPWSKENPEAFAGLHNQGKRILVIFDEASAILDEIWRVTEGAVTDANTEIIWCVFGNPTRNTGKFYDCFNSQKKFWNTLQLDSRTVKISNKVTLNQWVEEYGEDSDFVKVHVRGLFPMSEDNQLISRELAEEAFKRKPEKKQYEFAPVVIGVDPAWTGSDTLAIVMRQGIYSHVLKEIPKNDNDIMVARLIADFQDQYMASAVFIDMGYGTGIYSAGKDMGRDNWKLVQFGGKADKDEYQNKRAEMWFEMKQWLKDGGCIDSEKLCSELCAPESFINSRGKHQIESKNDMKKRGVDSPNLADALGLTFAFPVRSNINHRYSNYRKHKKIKKWGAY